MELHHTGLHTEIPQLLGQHRGCRKLSDLVCMEHRLSVIENPKPHGKSYNKWLGGNAKPCQRDLLRVAIDAALAKKPKDFETFLKLVEAAGYTVKRGKHITCMRDGQAQDTQKIVFTREELSRNSGKPCYILEFYTDKCAYSYKVDAVSGDILEKNIEWRSLQESEPVSETVQSSDSNQRRIG